ncbi:unnamed protein product, partial [Allacma fusca]
STQKSCASTRVSDATTFENIIAAPILR